MIRSRYAAAAAVVLAAACLSVPPVAAQTVPSGRVPADTVTPFSLPGVPTAAVARKELAALKVKTYKDDGSYQRGKFGAGWAKVGDCTTRELVLKRDKHRGTFAKCTVTGGTWISAYDGLVLDAPGKLDIDHLVPLKDAWFSGAKGWTDAKRLQFANDMARPQLLAVSAQSNRSKGDRAPEEWMPPRAAYACTYVKAWTRVKTYYKLTITKEEKSKLAKELKAPCK
ncbi:HNH endonuclease family protein [Streptomyces sp. NPDC020799]|uniref:HNH endonuclease family protein n=1 Tax=Streptomyces sp. NPDC020799 TaxID=3365091 RepID=UPI0034871492